MVTISTSPDCGNAPKQAYVRDVITAHSLEGLVVIASCAGVSHGKAATIAECVTYLAPRSHA